MARAEHETREFVQWLGIEVVREITGRQEASDDELWQLVKQSVRNVSRQIQLTFSVMPCENGAERLEHVLDMLSRPINKGGNNANVKQ